MIGDQHFELGKTFNNVNFITPIKCPTGKRKSGQGVVTLTQAEEQLNHAIHATGELSWGLDGQKHPSKHYKVSGRRMMNS